MHVKVNSTFDNTSEILPSTDSAYKIARNGERQNAVGILCPILFDNVEKFEPV